MNLDRRSKDRIRHQIVDRQRRYGISAEEFDALLERQGGLCAGGCGRPATHLDHDHETGEIRGVLCPTCNMADVLGWRFDPDLTAEEQDALADLVWAALLDPKERHRKAAREWARRDRKKRRSMRHINEAPSLNAYTSRGLWR